MLKESVFKVGDVVTIRKDLYNGQSIDFDEEDGRYGVDGEVVMSDMLQFRGKKATIIDIDRDGEYILDIDNGEWYWVHLMFEEGLNL